MCQENLRVSDAQKITVMVIEIRGSEYWRLSHERWYKREAEVIFKIFDIDRLEKAYQEYLTDARRLDSKSVTGML
jgi:hypothetical protein